MSFYRAVASFIVNICIRGPGRYLIVRRAGVRPSTAHDNSRFHRWSVLVVAAIGVLGIAVGVLQAEDKPSLPSPGNAELFWSFRPLTRPEVTGNADQQLSAIDELVRVQLRTRGLELAPEADRRTLCRRLYLDLIGLPPSPEQLAQFLADTSSQAVETLVDQLLASPQYGERWGRQWLDVVGYADSNGYIRHDTPRPLAYHYRDYVIQSLNDDKPYDQFWVEQLAGDELVNYSASAELTPQQVQTLTATHYMRNAPDGTDTTEGNETTRVIERYAVLESLLQTTMSSMFGMTIDCARCHDHKFDPIPQRDYYALQAIFYPAFNVKKWVQPKDRWIYTAGPSEIAKWRASLEQADKEVAALQRDHQAWLVAHRPAGIVRWKDDFEGRSVASQWSPTAPGDAILEGAVRTKLDADAAPAAKLDSGKLMVIADAPGDSRWLSTQQKIDWTPAEVGQSVQVTFDLVADRISGGAPAGRIGYYIALHDHDDDSPVTGGNLLIDGNPAGGASLNLDYPGADSTGLGELGTSGYTPGRNYGVRVTRTGEQDYLLEHLVNGQPEEKTVSLKAEQLPDGAFGFELCCSRSFIVDNVVVESSPDGTNPEELNLAWKEYRILLTSRQQELAAAIQAVNAKRLPEPVKIAWATDLSPELPDVPLLHRGDYFQPGEPVPAAGLSALSDGAHEIVPVTAPDASSLGNARTTTGRRLAFARWATQAGSRPAALLARVQVDRLWRGHFGQGLVPSPENFGASGVEPTHPELLEWLASELVDSGWRLKHIHRLIVLSRTYRQSGEASVMAADKDPQNACYSRFPVHRLEAEQIRDTMLSVAGVLNPKAGGPSVAVVDPGNRQVVLAAPAGPGPHEVDRRSIYITMRRSQPLTFLRTFDQASPDPNCVSRSSSNVVAQSLSMLNSEFSQRMGREFAQRIMAHASPATDDGQIRYAFEVAFSREPSGEELSSCREFLKNQTNQRASENPEAARNSALADLCRLLLATNEFLYLP
ncbi:MAG: DUF1553 domain-containing protein [Planctomycetota bacterium]|nr:MAG: DUF1553 domain-containing protein [Planctomycetota bacterium]